MKKNVIEKLIGLSYLMRFDKPIGTLLLLWPTLSAFYILTGGEPDPILLIVFSLGALLMRSAGCVINDFFDKDFDGKVKRTKGRPLVTGSVSSKEALILFCILLAASAYLLTWTNKFTFLVACLGVLLTSFYPLTKRFFPFPQAFLGLAFSWGIIMVSAAELNSINLATFLMFFACFFWILAYDTIYAMCDKEDDVSIGINSSALTLGNNVRISVFIFHILSLIFWCYVGFYEGLDTIFFFTLFLSFLFIIRQMLLIKDYDQNKCLKAFKNNNWIGLLIFTGAFLGS
jgi:4-hydroxybenzoate polyprenyltransferase